MEMIDKLNALARKAREEKENIRTEEATKSALIMPFIGVLGYDVFSPSEVIPEFIADVPNKKGEKVDYAIKKDGEIIMLFEAKPVSNELQGEHRAQLKRYFNEVSSARFGVLTNGITYFFYSDMVEKNKMDEKPFFEFNLLNFETHHVDSLKQFSKSDFSLEGTLVRAKKLNRTGKIKEILNAELEDPSREFIQFFTRQIYKGNITDSVYKEFKGLVREARTQFIEGKINEHLRSSPKTRVATPEEDNNSSDADESPEPQMYNIDLITTESEIEGFLIVKSILRQVIDTNRVAMRDKKNFCNILLDNTNRKSICKLYFNSPQKYLGILVNKKEERIPITDLDDIFKHADKIISAVQEYDANASEE